MNDRPNLQTGCDGPVASRKHTVAAASTMGNIPKQQQEHQSEQQQQQQEEEEQDVLHLRRKQQLGRRKQRKRPRRKRVRALGTHYIFLLITGFVVVPIFQIFTPKDRRQSFNEDVWSVVPTATNMNSDTNNYLRSHSSSSNSSTTIVAAKKDTERIFNSIYINTTSSISREKTDVVREIDFLYCLKNRGTSGRWFDDAELSRRTFYPHGFRSSRWFKNQWLNQRQKLLQDRILLQQKQQQQLLLLQKQGHKDISSANISIRIDIHDFDEIYKGNRYNWEDDTASSSSHCDPIHPLTSKKIFCKFCNGLGIRRIMFVGDSTTKDQRSSLLHLIKEYNRTIMGAAEEEDVIVQCSNGGTTANGNMENRQTKNKITITLHRENLGPNIHPTMTTLDDAFPDEDNHTETNKLTHSTINSSMTDLLSLSKIRKVQQHQLNFGTEIPYCHGESSSTIAESPSPYMCPWHHVYQDFDQEQHQEQQEQQQEQQRRNKRTLLVLNQGAHFHSVETFSESLEKFIEIFKVIGRPDDIVVYRSTVPGHKDCWDDPPRTAKTVTNMTYELFLQRYATTQYDWNLFDEYNQYARHTLQKAFSSTTGTGNNYNSASRIHFHYLNVYNMTVLRYDQHVKQNDCLHYTLPGPVDFWNHLLFTNLHDMMSLLHRNRG